jgi:hypothetical protein
MIEDAPMVKDIRQIRCLISRQFNDDSDQYIDYLLAKETKEVLKSDKSGDKKHYQALKPYQPVQP